MIGEGAFRDCISLAKIEIESGNKSYIFKDNCLIETASKTLIWGCPSSKIATDGSVERIGNSAFGDRKDLHSITIPNGIKEIGIEAFSACHSLDNVTVPGSVKK